MTRRLRLLAIIHSSYSVGFASFDSASYIFFPFSFPFTEGPLGVSVHGLRPEYLALKDRAPRHSKAQLALGALLSRWVLAKGLCVYVLVLVVVNVLAIGSE